ncbi:MAG: serine protease [Hyphomicrobiales bacterium]
MTITITHLEGPLKDEVQTFGDDVDAVVFGRDREVAQVVYPPEYDIVGRRHFELRRTKAGDYTVELFGTRYVNINGKPADNAPVKSGSIFRLGGKSGPSFKVEIGAPAAADLPVTGKQEVMPTIDERIRRYVAYAGSAVAIALVGVIGYVVFLHSTFAQQIEIARAEAAAQSKTRFSEATLQMLEAAVYAVVKTEDGVEESKGTAWAFAPHALATNAHVTEAIKGHEDEFTLKGSDGKTYTIKNVISHPGYLAFKSFKTKLGTTRWGEFTPLDLINEYDVGIIEIEETETLPVLLKFASEEELEKLTPGTPVASIGFPVEGLAGGDTAASAPGTLHFGHISSLTDVFMVRAEPEHRLLIQHSVPVTGGASGSPLIDTSGKVIGLVNGGNTTVFKDTEDSVGAKVRLPSAALINFAQRVDLLEDLKDGKADEALAADETYWQERGKEFDDYFDVAVNEFKGVTKKRYQVGEGELVETESGELDAGKVDSFKLESKSYDFDVEPGKVYGFIADAESGVPIGINVKNKATSKFVRDAKDPRQTSELELAPTAWITVTEPTTLEVIVWSLVTRPAKYELFAYEWPTPKTAPSSDAGS